jgi:hypothetical protein
MPATPDHKVEMHQLARSRVAAGLPVWDQKLRLADVFHNDAMTFEQRRDAIVQRIRDIGHHPRSKIARPARPGGVPGCSTASS